MLNSQNMDFKEYTNKELAEMILALEKRIKKLEKPRDRLAEQGFTE